MTTAHAQSKIEGEYYLHGVTETASGFLLKPDHTFEFFFSYGALDRNGSGKWTKEGNNIVLNSRPRPAHDFALITSKSTDDDSVIIKITDRNQMLQKYVYALVKFSDASMEGFTNDEGEIKFPRKTVESISLVFQFALKKLRCLRLIKIKPILNFVLSPGLWNYFSIIFTLHRKAMILKAGILYWMAGNINTSGKNKKQHALFICPSLII